MSESKPKTCRSCIYFWEADTECRRDPPIVHDGATGWATVWPRPAENDWCGQWTDLKVLDPQAIMLEEIGNKLDRIAEALSILSEK